MDALDKAITTLDAALRAVAGVHRAERGSPAQEFAEPELSPTERAHVAALMRVNHVGEVCAQALYQGQALTTRDPQTRASQGVSDPRSEGVGRRQPRWLRLRPGPARADRRERRPAGPAQRPGRRLVAARAGGGQHQVEQVGEQHGTTQSA